MSGRAGKPILPWPVLALGVVLAAVAVLLTFVVSDWPWEGDGASSASPTPRPTASLGPVSGKIGYITPDGNFALLDGNGANQRVLTSSGDVKALAWAPDASVVALETGTGAATAVRGINPDDGAVVFEVDRASQPLWSPSGDKLAVAGDGTVAVYDGAGSLLRTFEQAARPTWSPDGASLAFIKLADDGKGVPVIADVSAGDETPLSAEIAPADPVYPIAWHPAGSVIAYRNRLYEPATGTTTDLPGTAVYWSPNGRMLLVAGEFAPADRATPGYLLDAAQGFKQVIGLSIRPSAQDIPAQLFIQKWTDWSPDGRYLFYMDPEPERNFVRIYDTDAVKQDIYRNIGGERPDISPDGLYATFMQEGKVWVFPLDASALVAVVDGANPAWRPTP